MGDRMDIALVGVPKSGTSMLCNALTIPGEAVVLYEPWADFDSPFVRRQAESLGYDGPDILAWARSHPRWGVKEVKAHNIRAALERDPGILLLLLRNLGHSALSMFETQRRLGVPWEVRRGWMEESARLIVQLSREWPADRLVVCRYEQLVGDPGYREELRRRIGWPSLDGDVGRGLAEWLERPHEAERHGGAITDRSVRSRAAEADPEALAAAAEVARACASFNEEFGYEVSGDQG